RLVELREEHLRCLGNTVEREQRVDDHLAHWPSPWWLWVRLPRRPELIGCQTPPLPVVEGLTHDRDDRPDGWAAPNYWSQTPPEGVVRNRDVFVPDRCGSEVCWRAWIEHMFAALGSPARCVSAPTPPVPRPPSPGARSPTFVTSGASRRAGGRGAPCDA